MRYVKPYWLVHGGEKKDHEVYSCHVSPDGSRLATAAGDGHVRIWSTEAILNASNPSYTQPKQLAALSYHSGTVHSVRFSPNGKYLASGADDKLVCVYSLEPGAPGHTTFGSNEAKAVENWRVYRRLIGHDNDVQDLGWSYDSSILVSVGLDSKVVVWSGSTFEKLKTLAQHQSHVKGITFDPANKYFATASDDRTIKIYRFTSPPPNATAYDQTSNFILEQTVSAPFGTSPLTTYFRRCSWSPEGAHIAAANATNGPVSSVAIVNRGSWDSEINLIGHEGPVEVCAFSPRLFMREPAPAPPANGEAPPPMPNAVSVVACAGQDKTISVWNTTFPRPFATTAEMCSKPISDLAWHPDGETLFFSSLDGKIAALVFQQGELGYPSSSKENDRALAKYGAGRRVGIVEGADALRLEESSKVDELRGVQGRMGELMGDAGSSQALALLNGDAPQTNGVNGTLAITNGTSADTAPAPAPPKDPQQEKIDKIKNRVTFTKDGKKRIAPVLLSTSNQGESNLPRPQLQASVKAGAASDDPAGKTLDLSKPYDGLPKGGLVSLLLGNKRKYAEMDGDDDEERKRAEKRVQAIQQTGATPVVNNTPEGLAPSSAATAKKVPTDVPEALRPSIVSPSLAISQVRLAIPAVRSVILRPLDPSKSLADTNTTDDTTDGDSVVIFEARNASGPSRTGRAQDREPTRITLSRRSQTLWQDFLPRAVLLTTGNRNFWAATCEDGSLYLWTPAGRRLLSAMILESQPVILDCKGWWLLAVTAVGQCYVWNIKNMSTPHPPISLAPALDAASMAQQNHLTSGPAVMFARLNSQGRIIVGMSNGDGFAYNPTMYVWQRLSESWWAVGSQYWNTTDTSITVTRPTANTSSKGKGTEPSYLDEINPENVSAGIIPLLERNTTSQALLKGRAYFLQRLVKQLLSAEGFEGFESSVSIAHLENRVAAAMALGAKDEFRVYLIMYAKRIGAEGLRGKVEELLGGLMGRMFEDQETEVDGGGSGSTWGDDEDIVGWNRMDLLKEAVMVLGKHRDLQRITVQYAKVLGIASTVSADGDVQMITEGER
ncbi:histone transcription regulator HIRA, WD repeat superfamily [Teratosphaeria nubilosa]|uniref:Protein HIR n=1 Tax=Teratosphaeria nubilosa TaxID=161662 RepID=A0A6G1LGF7_9PEZI|nr:histone transcription regulator HIRA, WD repeat superfamily [Teratosphaeria nubilosa]